jgi:iron complex outermembrane recepter protein
LFYLKLYILKHKNSYTRYFLFVFNLLLSTSAWTQDTSSKKMAEVVISTKKQFITKKLDKTIVNPELLISNAGVSAVEVLEKSPGVSLDMNGNISLKGKSGVEIYIDDKQSYLKAADLISYLKSIPSSLIDRIEIMTNPSAKYDAAGNAGIINIILKKNKAFGYSGGINLSYGKGRHFRSNNSINMSYRVEKLNFFSSLGITENNSFQDLTITRNYYDHTNKKTSTFIQNSLFSPEARSQSAKFGLDFYASSKTTCGFVIQAMRNPTYRSVVNNAELINYDLNTKNYILATNPTQQQLDNLNLNFNLQHKFDSLGRDLTINVDRLNYDFLLEQNLTNTISNSARIQESQSILNSFLPAKAKILSLKMDYSSPILNGGKIDMGLKFSLVQTENNANFYDIVGTNKSINYTFSNNFSYKENINAAYFNFSKEFKKLSIQAGLRFENSNINGYQYGNPRLKDSSFDIQYNNFFPTFYLQYNLDSALNHQLIFSYGSRIDRPQYKDLNPFTYPIDRYTLYGGNPFLQPTYSYNFNLTHVYKNIISTNLEYSIGDNLIFETNQQENGVFYSRPGNFARQISFGISVEGAHQVNKWLNIQLYAGVFNNIFKSQIYTEYLDNSKWYFVIQNTNLVQISKTWSAEFGINYQSEVLMAQFYLEPIWSARLGIAKKILKDKATVKFNVSDLFYSNQITGQINNIKSATAGWYSLLDSRVFTLSVSYKFNKGKSLGLRQTGASDVEQKRIKSN